MKPTILEGLHLWSVFQPDRGIDFNGFFWVRGDGANVLIDPLPVDETKSAFIRAKGGVRWILITNADHWRAADALRDTFRAEIYAPAAERARLDRDGRRPDHWYDANGGLPGVLRESMTALPIRGGKTPGEMAFYLKPLQALLFGDIVRTSVPGRLGLLPDAMLSDKASVLDSLRRAIPLVFKAILLGDGDCIFHDARERYFKMLDHVPGALFNKVNLHRLEFERGSRHQAGAETESAQVSRLMTCRQLGYHMRRLLPGNVWPAFHYETGEEEMFLVWKGTMKVRTPQGIFGLVPGDLVAMPTGPAHAHQFLNDGTEPCEFFCLGVNRDQSLAYYPDTNRIMVSERGELYRVADRREDYWEDDPTVGRGPTAKEPPKEDS
ncbi:MAG TPA: MBL fold metallo-hydrolase [Candidatus Polarisedimenticolia bacterium]|nr:MBL fold metallo-hydrolase [Candidatus Polarisedimenticolia bacterium]